MLSIVGRCRDGTALAHELSRPYPRYSDVETTKKLAQAIDQSSPRTCANIQELSGNTYCQACPHAQTFIPSDSNPAPDRVSPITIGYGQYVAQYLQKTLATTPSITLVYELMPYLSSLSTDKWAPLKSTLKKLCPELNLNDLERARSEARQELY